MLKKIIPLTLITLAIIVSVCSAQLRVHCLNVGQGDATLIQTEEQNILIDTADAAERQKLKCELYRLGAYKLDKIILTHPHADHIGNAAYLVRSGVINVKSVYDNGEISASKYYLDYIKECKKRNVPKGVLKSGDVMDFGGGVKFIVLHSGKVDGNANNESIIGRLEYGNFSMLLTGDAETPAEEKILGKLKPVNILKAGHHGSRAGSSKNFLAKINPEYVIISAGAKGNRYGHPHFETLERIIFAGVDKDKIYWTWANGTITIESDGETFTAAPQIKNNWIDKYMLEKAGYVITRL